MKGVVETEIPFKPEDADIVSTKLRTWNLKHPGNIFYTELVQERVVTIKHHDDQSEFRRVASEIVDVLTVERGGRFLKLREGEKDPTTCYVMDRRQCVNKVAHALRTAQARQEGANSPPKKQDNNNKEKEKKKEKEKDKDKPEKPEKQQQKQKQKQQQQQKQQKLKQEEEEEVSPPKKRKKTTHSTTPTATPTATATASAATNTNTNTATTATATTPGSLEKEQHQKPKSLRDKGKSTRSSSNGVGTAEFAPKPKRTSFGIGTNGGNPNNDGTFDDENDSNIVVFYKARAGTETGTGANKTTSIDKYVLKLITLVCNQQGDPAFAFKILDDPIDDCTLEEESEKHRLMRLQIRHRFASAAAVGMTPLDFSIKLLKLWGGKLIEVPANKKETTTRTSSSRKENGEKIKQQKTKPSSKGASVDIDTDSYCDSDSDIENTNLQPIPTQTASHVPNIAATAAATTTTTTATNHQLHQQQQQLHHSLEPFNAIPPPPQHTPVATPTHPTMFTEPGREQIGDYDAIPWGIGNTDPDVMDNNDAAGVVTTAAAAAALPFEHYNTPSSPINNNHNHASAAIGGIGDVDGMIVDSVGISPSQLQWEQPMSEISMSEKDCSVHDGTGGNSEQQQQQQQTREVSSFNIGPQFDSHLF